LSFQQRRPHRSGRGRSLQTEDVLAVRGNKHDGYTVEFESKGRRVFRRLPTGATKGQAEAYELKLRRELIDQAVLGQAPAITIAAAVKAWQEEVAEKRTSSKKEQASKIKITLEGLDELQLGGHHLTDIQAVAQELEELWEGKAPSTINSRLNVLKATCKWAWKKKRWTVYNLSPFVTPQRVGPGRARTIDEPTIAKLIKKAATAEGKAFIALGAYALMRQSEVMRLDPADAKGGIKIRDWDDRVRTIDIVPQLRPHLKALPLTRHKRTLYTEFEAARDALGLQDLVYHDLRRSGGTILLNRGVPLEVVSHILGHKDLETTRRIYAHVLSDTVKRAMRKGFKPIKNPIRKKRATSKSAASA
jgi:integrase